VLDADGSFLTPEHTVTEQNAEAIRTAREAGLQVFLATGRACSGKWVDECLTPLGLSYPGCFLQGLTAFNASGGRVLNAKLKPSVVTTVQAVCERVLRGEIAGCSEGITMSAYVQERLVVACADDCDPRMLRYADYGDGVIDLPSEEFAASEARDLMAVLGDDVGNANKLLLLSDEASVDTLRGVLDAALEGKPARVVQALSWTLEILPEDTSKAAGLAVLLDGMGIEPSRVMAVGDGENDIEMMRMVGLPVAMGNAVPQLKEVVATLGGFTTASNTEDGVAQAIRLYALPRAPKPPAE